jgi:hypothetical protein
LIVHIGLFYVKNSFSPSTISNSTFKLIKGSTEYGGVLAIYGYTSYSNFSISRCIFTQCNATYGGALSLLDETPYIFITQTRFENNTATYGDDIDCWYTTSCLNRNTAGVLAASVCSTSTPQSERVMCNTTNDSTQLQNNCATIIVCIFYNILFILFLLTL